MAYRLFKWKRTKMNQARQRAPQCEGLMIWANPGRVDMEEGEGQGRFAWRPPAVFRPPPSLPLCFPGPFMRSPVKNAERRHVMMSSEGTSNLCFHWSEERSGYWQQQKWI